MLREIKTALAAPYLFELLLGQLALGQKRSPASLITGPGVAFI